ncbi:MAG: cysteine desulfurase [Bacteroidetes bacterium]|nr:MAG: cysteine desulfurase [Bacteroidota bacterium]
MEKRRVYFDNAATTPIAPEVVEAVTKVMTDVFGNPSSIHAYGREARSIIEKARRNVAKSINALPGEVFFTSGGTEADNMAIRCSVEDLGVERIITSPLEHHAVLHVAEDIAARGKAELQFVEVDNKGYVDLNHLEELLKNTNKKTLVSLMHANNEIGNLTDIKNVGALAKQYGAYFHTDTVQTMAHFPIDVKDIQADFITCSAHKFHGPKGIGFLYINNEVKIKPLIHGGAQERNMRAGTENIYGIVGLDKALQLAVENMEEHQAHVKGIKDYMIAKLEEELEGVQFNGDPKGNSLYTVLNVRLPESEKGEMMLFNLDIQGVACSGGSACSSGSDVGSHVLKALGVDASRPSVRFSFSRYNTKEEVDYVVEVLKEIYGVTA